MPGLSIEYSDEEMQALRAQAEAAGLSLKKYVRHVSLRDAQRRQFVASAGTARDRVLAEFQDLCPEDLPPGMRTNPGQAAA